MVIQGQSGLSLIEMMVSIAIMMLLALAVAPFASSWGSQAAVRQTQHMLQQAMSQLKASALRNPSGVSASAAAVLVSVPGQLCVRDGLPAALDCGQAGQSGWTALPPASIKLNGAFSQCVALDSAGMPVAASIGGVNCGTSMSFSISKGTESSDGTLY
ncbi:type II secretion system protein [Paucibacter sp. Y2R2-4]|uniref:type II secretion system protein n=1 Tax=Paucibacter sp. Y2R2-4 TaxID=2893553 RepID=UPI0021E4D758|nr:prepilin-type N-terminal cleavage/methylation domain-containing protein [Paucibacter sp. Y2R2-4]MCV2348506.1 prepilin-type N-terminal cleavage/methylation domain-containing protein [Paucibacter sp. Y2R2-4]